MNNRERILNILNRKKPDRVPWFGDLDYWYGAQKIKKTLPSKYDEEGYFRLNRDYGLGFYLQGFFPFIETTNKTEISYKVENSVQIGTLKTPIGQLQEIKHFSKTSYSWGYTKHFVQDAKDLEILLYHMDDIQYQADYDRVHQRYDLIGDNGVVLCYTPKSPFMELLTRYIGVENTIYLCMDEEDTMDELLSLMSKKHDQAAQLTLDSPAECIMIPENLSSEVVGKKYYADYLKPYHTHWTKAIHQKGKYSFIHMDGTLKGLLKEVGQAGFDVIEAVTPQPSGDMTMEEIEKLDVGNSILWGGLPGVIFTPAMDENEFKQHVIDVLSIMRKSPRFVLGVADQIPPDGLMDRVKQIKGLCEEYGVYD